MKQDVSLPLLEAGGGIPYLISPSGFNQYGPGIMPGLFYCGAILTR
jgi:hypothetical protein